MKNYIETEKAKMPLKQAEYTEKTESAEGAEISVKMTETAGTASKIRKTDRKRFLRDRASRCLVPL